MPKSAGKKETRTLLETPSTSVERVPQDSRLHRLHCGAVFTEGFIQYLTEFWNANRQAHPDLILAFDYVSCIDGPRAGEAWQNLRWLPENAASPAEQFQVGDASFLIPRRTQKALKNKTVDVINGPIQVT
jgi:hypothetical protein